MPGEWVWGVVSALSGLVFVLTLTCYAFWTRIPTNDDLFTIGEALIDAKLKEFGVMSEEGRPAGTGEGLIDKVLRIPGVSQAIGGVIQKFASQQGQGWMTP